MLKNMRPAFKKTGIHLSETFTLIAIINGKINGKILKHINYW
jgi:hypothetical protein